jgi:hypothetical protein
MVQDDTSYYRQRAVTHRAMALAAEGHKVREIHEEFARHYEALAKPAELRSTCLVDPRPAHAAVAVAVA